MNEAELKAFLEENTVEINARIRDKILERVVEEYKWNIEGEVSKAVNEWVASDIVPEVIKALDNEKGAIVTKCVGACAEIGDILAKEMIATATKNVTSYNFRYIAEKLFGY